MLLRWAANLPAERGSGEPPKTLQLGIACLQRPFLQDAPTLAAKDGGKIV